MSARLVTEGLEGPEGLIRYGASRTHEMADGGGAPRLIGMTTWSVPGMPDMGRCLVMGVVNVTPDSFSDGGQWFDPAIAIRHGLELVEQGADIVDVGGEST